MGHNYYLRTPSCVTRKRNPVIVSFNEKIVGLFVHVGKTTGAVGGPYFCWAMTRQELMEHEKAGVCVPYEEGGSPITWEDLWETIYTTKWNFSGVGRTFC
jgi:hypothetical protein